MKKNIVYMDIMKALGIIAVVIGHSGAPNKFFYSYHMALFFFISGYFYDEEYSYDILKLVKRRIKTLYLPFVGYGLGFLLLHNIFCYLNLYKSKATFQGESIIIPYTFKEFIKSFIDILTFGRTEPLLAATWFIISLFTVNILFCIISYISKKVEKKQELVRILIIVIIFVIGNLLSYNGITLPREINTSCTAILLFYSGFMFKKYESKIKINSLVAILFFVVSVLISSKYDIINVGENIYPSIFIFLVSSASGIYWNIFLSKFISENLKNKKILINIGKNSLHIMTLHFLCFKLVNLFIIKFYDLPNHELASLMGIKGYKYYWIVNCVIGIFIPISLYYTYNIILSKNFYKKVIKRLTIDSTMK